MPGPQPRRVPEEVRQAILRDLAATPPKTYRQLAALYGVSQGTISDIKRTGNHPMRKPEPPPASAQEGDGLSEFIPGKVEQAPSEHASSERSPSAPSVRSERALTERSPSTPPTGGSTAPSERSPSAPSVRSERALRASERPARVESCPSCRRSWSLDAGDVSPATCPSCSHVLDAQRAAVAEGYACTACGFAFTIDAGDELPKACPRCGEGF